MALNIYTAAQVQAALIRAQVAMLLISQKIASSFLYLNLPQYNIYKSLQYDIYCLLNVVSTEQVYVGFTSTPDLYDQAFYGLVGAMIDKTIQADFTGAYGGAQNPNYQAPGSVIEIINPIPVLQPMDIPWSSMSTDDSVDGGRNTYYNFALQGVNPFMQLDDTTLLYYPNDYTLIGTGGFTLNSNGNVPFIYEGSVIRVYNYQYIT